MVKLGVGAYLAAEAGVDGHDKDVVDLSMVRVRVRVRVRDRVKVRVKGRGRPE